MNLEVCDITCGFPESCMHKKIYRKGPIAYQINTD